MGVSLAFLQNKTLMQLSREGCKCESSALKWLYRKVIQHRLFRFLIFTACLSGGRRWEQREEWRADSRFWLLDMGNVWCCAPPVTVQQPFLISASVELQTKFMQKSFTYFLSEEFIQPVIYSGIIPQQGRRKKKAGGALLWIIHPVLPAWVQSDPFAWPLLGLGRRAGCLPYLRWLLGLIGALNTHKHTLSRVRGQPTHCDLKFDSFYSFHVGWPHFSLGNCLARCLCLGCTVLQEPGWSPLNTGDSNVPLHRCTLWPYIPYPELPPSITRENEKQEQLLSDQPPSLCHLKTLEDAHF